jgi:hypothetical protein
MKNYEAYFNKLLDFARVCNLRVYMERSGKNYSLKETDEAIDLGEFDPRKRTVSINSNIPPSTQIAVFLHELGHFYDHMKDPKFAQSKKLLRGYTKYIYSEPVTPEEKKRIVECERRAWANGAVIAKLLGIPLGRWYKKERTDGMAFYRSIPVKES